MGTLFYTELRSIKVADYVDVVKWEHVEGGGTGPAGM